MRIYCNNLPRRCKVHLAYLVPHLQTSLQQVQSFHSFSRHRLILPTPRIWGWELHHRQLHPLNIHHFQVGRVGEADKADKAEEVRMQSEVVRAQFGVVMAASTLRRYQPIFLRGQDETDCSRARIPIH